MKKDKNKKRFIIIIIVIALFRFWMSSSLPSLFISNLVYDDQIMVNQMNSLIKGHYLGVYNDYTLIKGIAFPLVLAFCKVGHISYSTLFTFLYILAVIYFIRPFEKLISNKKMMFAFYIILLFNPVTYSSELFQRLYRNSIAIIELLFFLGVFIRIILSDDKSKKSIINYFLLGIISSIMYLTREDNMWIKLVFLFIIVYKYFNHRNIKKILICFIPFIILTINLNIVSFINYKVYGIYTYNEVQKSEFKNTFKKVLQIKDNEKKDKVSIPKTTFFKLTNNIPSFNITKRNINQYYKVLADNTGEIYNGNIIWYFRQFVYRANKFKDGKEAEKYYKKLGKEIDDKFKDGTFKKEFVFASILLNVPTANESVHLPKNIFDIIIYTTTYKNVKTITDFHEYKYNNEVGAYQINHFDSHTTENIVKKNDRDYEFFRIIYMILTVIFAPISLIIYIYNIKKKDIYNDITTVILFIYLIILAGVSYTDATAFSTMRYLCLGNLYVLQSIFIILNIYRLYNENKVINIKETKSTKRKKKVKK